MTLTVFRAVFLGAFTICLCVLSYYLGYRMASQNFLDYCSNELLNDRVSATLYSWYGDSDRADTPLENENEQEEAEASETPEEPLSAGLAEAAEKLSTPPITTGTIGEEKIVLYEARLVGFGARRHAEAYAHQAKSLGVEVLVIERTSTNARGRKVVWYQVVTTPHSYEELVKIVELLTTQHRLKGVVIVEVVNSGTGEV